MLRKLIALGIVAGLTKKAWDHYHTTGARPTAANGNAPARRRVKPAPTSAASATPARPEHKS